MPELSHRARIGFRRPGSGPLAAVARKLRAISSVLCKSCQSWAAQATSPLSGIGPWLTAAGDGKPSAACGTGSAESRAALWNGLTTRWPARNRVGGPERPRPHGRRPRRARPGSRRGACGSRAQTNAGHPATPPPYRCMRPPAGVDAAHGNAEFPFRHAGEAPGRKEPGSARPLLVRGRGRTGGSMMIAERCSWTRN